MLHFDAGIFVVDGQNAVARLAALARVEGLVGLAIKSRDFNTLSLHNKIVLFAFQTLIRGRMVQTVINYLVHLQWEALEEPHIIPDIANDTCVVVGVLDALLDSVGIVLALTLGV